MLVFRPFVGEILAGKVSSCTKQGIKVCTHIHTAVLHIYLYTQTEVMCLFPHS